MGNNQGVHRVLLLFTLLLGGCRYTFLPLVPKAASPPKTVLIEAALNEEEGMVRAVLRVHRVPGPGYLELRWYRGKSLLWEGARFVEGGETLALELPKDGAGPYRLELFWQGERVLVRPLGSPTPPKATPPEWKGN